jgi:YesN/AraC family two-component response regulator
MSDYNNTITQLQDNSARTYHATESKPLVHVIEDNCDMRMLIKEAFCNDYRVILSEDGLTGYKKTLISIPDIIICDIQMPGLNGINLCKLLKEDARTSHIPVVLITVYNDDECVLNGLESGADDYLIKPFNFSILKARVDNLLKLRQQLLKRFLNRSDTMKLSARPGDTHEKFLKKACEIIDRHMNNSEFEANDFAREIGMSRAQIYRKIKIITGQSVKEFIRIIRLKKAADLLISTDFNVSEVAYQVGFSSAAYFSSSFSNYFKISPSQYILLNKD